MTWILFLLTAGLIVYAGTLLARYGDVLAEKTGLGRTWIGLVVVAATTSLPELFTGISASVQGLPDIAVGDVLGSCMFNLLILSLMDAVGGRIPLSSRAHQGHALSIGLGLVLIGLVGLSLLGGAYVPRLGWLGLYSLLFAAAYLLAMRLIFRFEQRRLAGQMQAQAEARYASLSLRTAATRYSLAAAVVILATTFLPHLGEQLAQQTGWGQAFVGTLLIAVTTSLPEVVVSLAAVRMGALELGLGNVLGSNLFNILILALDDLAFTRGPLLASVHPSHQVAVLAVMLMYGLLLTGLTYQTLKKQTVLAWDTSGILVVYLLAMGLIFLLRT